MMMRWLNRCSTPLFGARRVLFIGQGQVLLFVRHRCHVYADDEAGRASVYARLMKQPDHWPLHVVVDTAEEQFRHELLPAVNSADRKRLLDRLQRKLFPQMTHGTCLRHGRLACVSTLGAMARFTPWLALLKNLPVAGLYTPPLLSAAWLRRSGLDKGCVLLISIHTLSDLRQSVFIDGLPYFARLLRRPENVDRRVSHAADVDHPDHSDIVNWQEAQASVAECFSFIGRDQRDQPLTVVLLSHSSQLPGLRTLVAAACRDSRPESAEDLPIREYRVDAASRIGRNTMPLTGCESVLARCVSDMHSRHYASAGDCRLWRRRRRGSAFFRAGLSLLLVTPLVLLALLSEADAYRYEALAYQERTARTKQRLIDLLQHVDKHTGLTSASVQEPEHHRPSKPDTSPDTSSVAAWKVPPERLREWVESADRLIAGYRLPLTMWNRLTDLLTVDGILRRQEDPEIIAGLRWHELQWNASANGEQGTQEAVIRLRAAEGTTPAEALRRVETLVRRLRNGQPPLSASYSVPQSTDSEPALEFTLRLIWTADAAIGVVTGGDGG